MYIHNFKKHIYIYIFVCNYRVKEISILSIPLGSTWHPIEVSRTNVLCIFKNMCRQMDVYIRALDVVGEARKNIFM